MWEPWAAIILAGGRASRLDGADKAGIEVGGRTLLTWSIDSVIDAREVVVVGEPVRTERPVTFTRENPRYGGPVAGLLTGLDALVAPPRYVGVVAVDMPHVTHSTWRRLLAATGPDGGHPDGHPDGQPDGAMLVGPDGRWQLALVLSVARLAKLRPSHEEQHDYPLKRLLGRMSLASVPAEGREHEDIDTWADLRDI